MKLLVLMIGFPYPPTSGGQLRDFNLIKELSKKFKIDLLIHSSANLLQIVIHQLPTTY